MSQITGKTFLTGLLGSPVSHSLSPLMHNFSFQMLGLNGVYLCFDVKEAELEAAVRGLRTLKVKGFNVTMPNKNKVLAYLDELSPAAKLIGAVNTVENRDGRLIGHNTDGIGFLRSMEENNIVPAGKTVTLMGIGGAATAICAQAALDGVKTLHIFARTSSAHLSRIQKLIASLSLETTCQLVLHDFQDKKELKAAISESDLFVNATSVGMAPDLEGCVLPDASYLETKPAVADIIYNPWKTKLLSIAEDAGCQTFNGYSMMLHQGAEAFRIWTGQDMPLDQVRQHLAQ